MGDSLHNACAHLDLHIVDLLIRRGALVNAVTSKGWLPLHMAASQGGLDIVQRLLENDTSLNDSSSPETNQGVTPFFLACRW